MTAKEIVRILKADGWIKKAQKGSHLQMVHPTKSGKVTIPIHKMTLILKHINQF